MTTTADTRRVPDEIEKKLKLWRKGLISIRDTGYIEFRQEQAEAALEELKTMGWRVVESKLVDDGWLDGMKFVQAILESTKRGPDHGDLVKIKWSDSGCWYKHVGGWALWTPHH